jgi:hypothetical protein
MSTTLNRLNTTAQVGRKTGETPDMRRRSHYSVLVIETRDINNNKILIGQFLKKGGCSRFK